MALYTAVFSGVAVTVAQDLFEVVSAADSITIIHAVELFNLTEVGDAQEENLQILYKSGQTTSGSGGTAPTPQSTETGSAAYGGVVEVNNTTKASAGTIVTRRSEGWNVRSPYLWLPTPEMRFILGPGVRMTVELVAAPADSITMSGTITFEEVGG